AAGSDLVRRRGHAVGDAAARGGDVGWAGDCGGQARYRAHLLAERERLEVALDEPRRVGIGDVFCQNALAFLMPAHLLRQRLEQRQAPDMHLQTLFTMIGKSCLAMVKSRLTNPGTDGLCLAFCIICGYESANSACVWP